MVTICIIISVHRLVLRIQRLSLKMVRSIVRVVTWLIVLLNPSPILWNNISSNTNILSNWSSVSQSPSARISPKSLLSSKKSTTPVDYCKLFISLLTIQSSCMTMESMCLCWITSIQEIMPIWNLNSKFWILKPSNHNQANFPPPLGTLSSLIKASIMQPQIITIISATMWWWWLLFRSFCSCCCSGLINLFGCLYLISINSCSVCYLWT